MDFVFVISPSKQEFLDVDVKVYTQEDQDSPRHRQSHLEYQIFTGDFASCGQDIGHFMGRDYSEETCVVQFTGDILDSNRFEIMKRLISGRIGSNYLYDENLGRKRHVNELLENYPGAERR